MICRMKVSEYEIYEKYRNKNDQSPKQLDHNLHHLLDEVCQSQSKE